MYIAWGWVLLLVLGMIALFRLGRAFVGKHGWFWAVHACMGLISLYFGHLYLGTVGINLVTLLIAGGLGVPGAALVLALGAL